MSTPTKVIGIRTKFHGGSGTGDHAYLQGREVVVVGVIRGALVVRSGVDYTYVADDDALTAVGGLDVAVDRLDVVPFVADEAVEGGKRPSFASSDVRCADLEAFAPAPVDPAASAVVERTAADYEKLRLVRQLEGSLQRATGKVYRIALDKLDLASLHELARLLRDLESEHDDAVKKTRTGIWRR